MVSGEKKTSLLLEPANTIFPEESVSIDVYLTSREFPLNPTGYLIDGFPPSFDFSMKRVVIQRQLMISLTSDVIGLSLTAGFLFKKDARLTCYYMFLSGILIN